MMSDNSYDIIFRGELLPGCVESEVKLRLMQLFKADAEKIDALFSGAAVPLKRNLDQAAAAKYQSVLSKAGLLIAVVNRAVAAPAHQVKIESEPASKSELKRELKPKLKPEPESITSANTEAVRAERLAEQAKRRAERRSSSADTGTPKKLSMSERLAKEEAERKVAAVAAEKARQAEPDNADGLSLAPVGASLLSSREQAVVEPVVVDTSGLSVRESCGELLDASEKVAEVEVVLDLGAFNLAEVGEDLLHSDERHHSEAIDVDTSALELDAVGGDLIRAEEKASIDPVVVDIAGIDLAPAGVALVASKVEQDVVLPDISGLSLE